MISKSSEEYLKNMYVIYNQKGNIRVTDVANKMGHTKASVNKAIHLLKDEGMIKYEPYGKVEITSKGKELARKTLEAYDIVYLFLKDVLNVEEEIATLEAEKMKAALSDSTINSIAKYAHKMLGLEDLNCCYDISSNKCRTCTKTKLRKEKVVNLKKGIKENGK
ncbi:MAG: metal-dependent transcriptional regulator [Clostridia bacterium]|nr:metal-dependent transcriptional regulator [Clostridia bacterium]